MPLAKKCSRNHPSRDAEVHSDLLEAMQRNGCRNKAGIRVNKLIYDIAILLILVLIADIVKLLNHSFLLG